MEFWDSEVTLFVYIELRNQKVSNFLLVLHLFLDFLSSISVNKVLRNFDIPKLLLLIYTKSSEQVGDKNRGS